MIQSKRLSRLSQASLNNTHCRWCEQKFGDVVRSEKDFDHCVECRKKWEEKYKRTSNYGQGNWGDVFVVSCMLFVGFLILYTFWLIVTT